MGESVGVINGGTGDPEHPIRSQLTIDSTGGNVSCGFKWVECPHN